MWEILFIVIVARCFWLVIVLNIRHIFQFMQVHITVLVHAKYRYRLNISCLTGVTFNISHYCDCRHGVDTTSSWLFVLAARFLSLILSLVYFYHWETHIALILLLQIMKLINNNESRYIFTHFLAYVFNCWVMVYGRLWVLVWSEM